MSEESDMEKAIKANFEELKHQRESYHPAVARKLVLKIEHEV